jgi:tetratricopeptide (TPR) repeat protein
MAKFNRPTNNPSSQEDTLIDLEQTTSKFRHLFDKNGKYLFGLLGVVVVLIVGWLGYKQFVLAPKEKEAAEKIFRAEYQFGQDSFANALKGQSGSYAGLLEAVGKYSGTKTGKLATYYAGMACLQNGQFDDAIKYLKEFSTSSEMFQALAYGGIGDAYGEKNDMNQSLDYYKKAAEYTKNNLTTPYFLWKEGLVLEQMGKAAEAKKCYERIRDEYPFSMQSENIEAYIARVE